MKIAFFDSGLGGLTVLAEAIKQLPYEEYIYYADTLHVPYGTKSTEEVKRYVKGAIETLMKEQQVKAIVIACNTATSIAVAELRSTYRIPIVGMEPAVKPALEMTRSTGKRVLVFATPLTLRLSKYTDLVSRIDDQCIVDSLPLPELVELCENLNFDKDTIIEYFQGKLSGLDLRTYGTIVLGCTHYPFYKDILTQMLPDHIHIIDGSIGTVNRLRKVLKGHLQLTNQGESKTTFLCSSGDSEYVQKMERALEIVLNK